MLAHLLIARKSPIRNDYFASQVNLYGNVTLLVSSAVQSVESSLKLSKQRDWETVEMPLCSVEPV